MRTIKIAVSFAAVFAFAAAVTVTGIVLIGVKKSYQIVNRDDVYI